MSGWVNGWMNGKLFKPMNLPSKVQLLLNAMRGFREWSFSMLAKFRVIYPANNKKALAKLEYLLKCIGINHVYCSDYR